MAGPAQARGCPLSRERSPDPGPRKERGRGGLGCPGIDGMQEAAAKAAGGGPQ